MKKISIIACFFHILACFTVSDACFLQSVSTAQQPKTVLDYYRLLPDTYFETKGTQQVDWLLDPERGSIVDIRNGYIFAQGDGAQASIWIGLFKKKDETSLVAVKTNPSDTDEYTYLDFYVFENNKLTNVNNKVCPIRLSENWQYEIPRYGTVIKVKTRKGKLLYKLSWTGSIFQYK